MENSLPPRNEEVTDEGREAFKDKEDVNFIVRAYDPEHELSEAEDTLKDKLENDILITMTKELRTPSFKNLSRLRTCID